MKNSSYARLNSDLVRSFGRAAPRKPIAIAEEQKNALIERVAEEIRQAHAEMMAERTLSVRPPSLVEHQNRNPRLRRTADEIAHYAVSVAAAEAGTLMN